MRKEKETRIKQVYGIDYTNQHWEINLYIIEELEKRDWQKNKIEEIYCRENRFLLTALDKSAEGDTDQLKNFFESFYNSNLSRKRTDLKGKIS